MHPSTRRGTVGKVPERSRSQGVEQLEVPQDEHSKVHRGRTAREVDEDVSVSIALVADRELVREIPYGDVRCPAEDQPRILIVPEGVAKTLFEVAPLLAFGAQPGDGPIREHAVQDHQALDRPVDRGSPAVLLSGSPMVA
jgi:hypothetical protein